ncbi:hypothetical protein [Pedobacter caeni]|uniref:Uncharacterized protein n=1 Tax=Pedobacter caeni TaxID=288992 RepID=A0A1M4WZA9_9SPHI|nr:hypothetical protein [Pedobacter caeni]SHE86540.1 hypothetical protein SAMN04488522_1011441 [Pedobacter caeni]
MKIKLIRSGILFLIFALFTLFTYEDNAAADGFTKLGFPFPFYLVTGGKLTDAGLKAEFGFFWEWLVVDIMIGIAFVIFGNFVAGKWRETK